MKKMKKMICVVAALSILLVLFCSGAYAAGGKIDQDEAKTVVLADAGLREKNISNFRVEYDREDGRDVYEIKFRSNGQRYEYVVEVESGRILERKIKYILNEKGTQIDLETAKKIALEKAALSEEEVVFSKAKQKKDDGRQIFDIEFFVEASRVYEYEIDLLTGTVLEECWELWDEDADHDYRRLIESKSESADTYAVISLEEAKTIALQNAGMSEEKVTLNKAKLEKDDGRLVYDIEFYEIDGFEYEYEIDALTGKVLAFETESWDGD